MHWATAVQIWEHGAGAPLYTGTPTWFIQTYQSTYHFCKINVNAGILTDSTFNINGGLIETFSLNKYGMGIENNNQAIESMSCLPNPTKGVFILHFHYLMNGEALITILDMKGNKISQEKVKKTGYNLDYRFDLSNHVKGVYFVQVEIGNQKKITKLELQ